MIFQFHKGAIGVVSEQAVKKLTEEFQFHKGAIGVNSSTGDKSPYPEFQFHKGAIGVRLKNRLVDANKAVFVL